MNSIKYGNQRLECAFALGNHKKKSGVFKNKF